MEFEYVILDEGHVARRLDGALYNMAGSLKWQGLVWATGTPLVSGLNDVMAPLTLAWRRHGFENFVMPAVGDLAGLYSPEYNPEREWNEVQGFRTKGLFHASVTRNDALQRMAEA